MDRLRNFIIILIASIYLLYLSTSDLLGFYLNPRYFGLSTYTSIFMIIMTLIGIVIVIRNDWINLKNDFIQNNDQIKNPKAYLILFLVFGILYRIAVEINITILESIEFVHEIILKITDPTIFTILLLILILPWHKAKFDKDIEKIPLTEVLIILIFIFALLMPPKILSNLTYGQRDSNLNNFVGSSTNITSIASRFGRNSSDMNMGDWIRSINTSSSFEVFEGQEIRVSGFITAVRDAEDYFRISRFALSCCVLDSTPVGLYVYSPGWQDDFNIDEWVQVEGEFQILVMRDDAKELVIYLPQIEPTNIPNDPYIS